MFIVALTGGIGSGKSTVADAFGRHGVPIIDTDLIARELVEPGQPAYQAIIDRFGKEVVMANGQLDRSKLRSMIFSEPEQRQVLEDILHPRIRQEVESRIRELGTPYCLLVIPLLIETGGYPFIDRVLLVDIPEQEQIRRTMARDQLEREQVERILASQSSRQQRLAQADDIIDNSGTTAELEQQVAALHHQYLALAEAKHD